MDHARRRELWESLEHQLTLESTQRNFTALQRVGWVSERVDEYIDRWLGFVDALPHLDLPSLQVGDTWGVIEIGSEILAKELERANAPPEVLAAWDAFVARRDDIHKAEHREEAHELLQSFRDFRAALPVLE